MNTADSNPDGHHQTLQTSTRRRLVNDTTYDMLLHAPRKQFGICRCRWLFDICGLESCEMDDSHMTQH